MILRFLFDGGLSIESVLMLLLLIVALFFSLSSHEYAHGLAAYSQGDHFAKDMGRLTLNPFKHLDPIGTIMLLFVGFGWAKPVPIVPANFKHGKASMIFVSLAGVICNILYAFLGMNILYFLIYVIGGTFLTTTVGSLVLTFFSYFISVNITLCVFNLIPLPPLDGYRVVKEIFVTYKNQYTFAKLEMYSQYINILLFIVLYTTNILPTISNAVYGLLQGLCNLIYSGYILL